MNLLNYLLVLMGGAMGSALRFGLMQLVITRWPQFAFPVGTFFVNVLGSFLIGILSIYFATRSPHLQELLRVFFMVGILGGFTTFSSFSLEAISLFYEGYAWLALGYVFASVGLALGSAWIGIMVGNILYA